MFLTTGAPWLKGRWLNIAIAGKIDYTIFCPQNRAVTIGKTSLLTVTTPSRLLPRFPPSWIRPVSNITFDICIVALGYLFVQN